MTVTWPIKYSGDTIKVFFETSSSDGDVMSSTSIRTGFRFVEVKNIFFSLIEKDKSKNDVSRGQFASL